MAMDAREALELRLKEAEEQRDAAIDADDLQKAKAKRMEIQELGKQLESLNKSSKASLDDYVVEATYSAIAPGQCFTKPETYEQLAMMLLYERVVDLRDDNARHLFEQRLTELGVPRQKILSVLEPEPVDDIVTKISEVFRERPDWKDVLSNHTSEVVELITEIHRTLKLYSRRTVRVEDYESQSSERLVWSVFDRLCAIVNPELNVRFNEVESWAVNYLRTPTEADNTQGFADVHKRLDALLVNEAGHEFMCMENSNRCGSVQERMHHTFQDTLKLVRAARAMLGYGDSSLAHAAPVVVMMQLGVATAETSPTDATQEDSKDDSHNNCAPPERATHMSWDVEPGEVLLGEPLDPLEADAGSKGPSAQAQLSDAPESHIKRGGILQQEQDSSDTDSTTRTPTAEPGTLARLQALEAGSSVQVAADPVDADAADTLTTGSSSVETVQTRRHSDAHLDSALATASAAASAVAPSLPERKGVHATESLTWRGGILRQEQDSTSTRTPTAAPRRSARLKKALEAGSAVQVAADPFDADAADTLTTGSSSVETVQTRRHSDAPLDSALATASAAASAVAPSLPERKGVQPIDHARDRNTFLRYLQRGVPLKKHHSNMGFGSSDRTLTISLDGKELTWGSKKGRAMMVHDITDIARDGRRLTIRCKDYVLSLEAQGELESERIERGINMLRQESVNAMGSPHGHKTAAQQHRAKRLKTAESMRKSWKDNSAHLYSEWCHLEEFEFVVEDTEHTFLVIKPHVNGRCSLRGVVGPRRMCTDANYELLLAHILAMLDAALYLHKKYAEVGPASMRARKTTEQLVATGEKHNSAAALPKVIRPPSQSSKARKTLKYNDQGSKEDHSGPERSHIGSARVVRAPWSSGEIPVLTAGNLSLALRGCRAKFSTRPSFVDSNFSVVHFGKTPKGRSVVLKLGLLEQAAHHQREVKALERLHGLQGVVAVEALLMLPEFAGGLVLPFLPEYPVGELLVAPDPMFRFVQEVVEIVIQCHERGVAHGDLKLDVFRQGRSGEIILIDWNMSASATSVPEWPTGTPPFCRSEWSPRSATAIDNVALAALVCEWVVLLDIRRMVDFSLETLQEHVAEILQNRDLSDWRTRFKLLVFLLIEQREQPLRDIWTRWLYGCWYTEGVVRLLPEALKTTLKVPVWNTSSERHAALKPAKAHSDSSQSRVTRPAPCQHVGRLCSTC